MDAQLTRIAGRITDEFTTCDCCGRTGLKATVEIQLQDCDGVVVGLEHYGRTCARRAHPNLTVPKAQVTFKRTSDVAEWDVVRYRCTRGKAVVGYVVADRADPNETHPYFAVTVSRRDLGVFATFADAFAAVVDSAKA